MITPIESRSVSSRIPLADFKPHLAGFMLGDLDFDPVASIKYGYLFHALERLYGPIRVFDISLRGPERWWNGLRMFHPNLRRWKERYYKNLEAFVARSRKGARLLRNLRGNVDIAIQIGVLFGVSWDASIQVPVVIYTDYTARLSAEDPYRFRAPLKGTQLAKWFDYEGQVYHRAAHIFVRSELIRVDIVNRYGVPSEKVSVVGGGVNFDPLPVAPLRGPKKDPIILFIGSEFFRKGGDLLLRAFAIVRKSFPSARLRILTRDDIPADLPMDGVDVIPYVWDRSQIARLYEDVDLFVLPSRQETWGDVVLEAAAYCLPCIGTRGQAMDEIIKDGETGLLVPRENIEYLAEAILHLLRDTNFRLHMGLTARKRAESFFTWDHVAARMAPVIDSILI